MLSIENLNKSFDDGSVALRDVNITVNKGDFVVLLGPSGSGKTSLINCINGLLKPETGKIKFKGQECINRNLKNLRKVLRSE